MDDPRVTVLNTYRTERAVARNTGAALSRGDWLYFLDDDDYALPGAFAAMLEVAERTQAATSTAATPSSAGRPARRQLISRNCAGTSRRC